MKTFKFHELVNKYPELRKYWVNGRYYFENNEAVALLNRMLFKDIFNVDVNDENITKDNLFPRIPGRFKYCECLVDCFLTPLNWLYGYQQFCFIDVGTGAYAVYAVLLSKMLGDAVKVIGSDIDEKSVENASNIIIKNNLQGNITLVLKDEGSNVFDLEFPNDRPVLTMCNPPFYSSRKEIEDARRIKSSGKTLLPIQGTDSELLTTGGELRFITQMIKNSMEVVSQYPIWFTTLVAKSRSLSKLVKQLEGSSVTDYYVHEFLIGTTTQWVLSWNFCNLKPLQTNKRQARFNKYLTFSSIKSRKVSTQPSIYQIKELIREKCCDRLILDIVEDSKLLIRTEHGDVWSRQYRRQNRPCGTAANVFLVETTSESCNLYWLQGSSVKIFESFNGFISRIIKCGL
ncbi:uncharacterized protein Ecym_6027 [Eremothecium cymbalariae DBVPG|uniref:U6 small nuclear RNA (adenine-(43)-N(6))-methyltransferase n=1 Tax=Eremothecium cymbalariae (strain CBS 270.75 / DBVPG 7215 / KCTC 17166 / NRRL Y-17582) TaxID=931890 RepID=G8JUV3_ERECY|nr:hypothetical protein Ecym_6027 [Eremothecium cymbalariae DBVPG\